METFRKASSDSPHASATVPHVGRSALRLAAALLLLAGGLALSILTAGPAFGLGTTTSATGSTATGTTATGTMTTTPSLTSPAKSVLVFSGHGWGHGLGWAPKHSFDAGGLEETVEWYRANREWWEPIKSGEYRRYYDAQYAARLA